MNTKTALVNKIIPFSSVDGPGNRCAIFLQGCNINCKYCHNPETISICNSCGLCAEECPKDALKMQDGKVVWNSKECVECDMCLKACMRNSSPKVKVMTVEDVMAEIKKVKPFVSGITVSGGECSLQDEFIAELFKEVKKEGLTTFIDTNGTVPLKDKNRLLEETDKVMLDVKSFDYDEHKMLTGKGNKEVLDNLEFLLKNDMLYEVRTVVVPNLLDNSKTVDKVSQIIAQHDENLRYKLIRYRAHGVRSGLIDSNTPDDDTMFMLKDIAHNNGCKCIIIT